MTHFKKAAALMAVLALSACTNPSYLGDYGSGNGNGTTAVGDGSASDPRSPLYFQQAVGDRVLFEIDQAVLTQQSKDTLARQAEWLDVNREYTAVIEGHADEQGTREYNLALGARRANAAREYLISRGIPANRIETISYGKERPIEICSEEACYANNRRAVTIISSGLSS